MGHNIYKSRGTYRLPRMRNRCSSFSQYRRHIRQKPRHTCRRTLQTSRPKMSRNGMGGEKIDDVKILCSRSTQERFRRISSASISECRRRQIKCMYFLVDHFQTGMCRFSTIKIKLYLTNQKPRCGTNQINAVIISTFLLQTILKECRRKKSIINNNSNTENVPLAPPIVEHWKGAQQSASFLQVFVTATQVGSAGVGVTGSGVRATGLSVGATGSGVGVTGGSVGVTGGVVGTMGGSAEGTTHTVSTGHTTTHVWKRHVNIQYEAMHVIRCPVLFKANRVRST